MTQSMDIQGTEKNMTDTLAQETNGNYGGSHMWEVIHDADNIKLPAISKPPMVVLLDSDEARKARNPFKIPPGIKITQILEDEINLNKREREKQLKLSVQDKTTYSRRTKQLPKIERDAKLPPVNGPRQRNIDENGLKSKRQLLSEHIQNMRQRRLILYSGHIMKEEMKKLDELIEDEERKLNLEEEDMRASLNKLDEARMEMDQKHIEARQMSRQLVMDCHRLRVKINRITSHKMSLELDISDAKEKLTDYKMYHDILKKLSLQREEGCDKSLDVEETHVKFGSDKSDTKVTGFVDAVKLTTSKSSKNLLQRRKSLKIGKFKGAGQKLMKVNRSFSTVGDSDLDEEDIDTDRDLGPVTTVDVYFDSPESVMELISELYYQNITRILKFRQIEDELKETQIALVEAGKRKEAMLMKLTEHIKERSEDIKRKKNKLNDIKIKVMIHSGGTNTIADKEAHWENLKKKVNDVYVTLLGKSKVRITTEQKLTNIENRLFELLHHLEGAPPERVEALWEAKSKEKKQFIKELCYKDLKERRKELIKKSWDNVMLASKRGPTRKLMYRSKVSVKKKNKNQDPVKIFSYDDDMAYYFSV